jgi:flavin-binding protein dodecin
VGQLARSERSGQNFAHHPRTRGESMAAVKIIELIGTSSKSSDDAVQQALAEARTSLRNIKAIDLVSTGLRGDNLDEWRAHVRVAFLVERVSE